MTAQLFRMPLVVRPEFGDPSWREQHQREVDALHASLYAPPARTRPLKVIDNDARRRERDLNEVLLAIARAISTDEVMA